MKMLTFIMLLNVMPPCEWEDSAMCSWNESQQGIGGMYFGYSFISFENGSMVYWKDLIPP